MAETVVSDDAEKTVIRSTSDDRKKGEPGYWESLRTEWKAGSSGANAAALDTRMDSALDGLRSYVALATPTAAQTAVAVKLLCRVAIAIIRLQRGRLDGID